MAPERDVISNAGSAISFGNYETEEKRKADGFEVVGDIYKIKTHNKVTRLEKNGNLLYESVPGSAVRDFVLTERSARFSAEGSGDTQITLGLEAETEYRIDIGGAGVGVTKSNLSGKVSFSAELSKEPVIISIEKTYK